MAGAAGPGAQGGKQRLNGEFDIQAEKKRLREQTDERLKDLTEADRTRAAVDLCNRMAAAPEWRRARSILAFAPMSGEINIWPLLAEAEARGVRLAFPRYDKIRKAYQACSVTGLADLQPGWYGIREPAPHCAPVKTMLLDLILVPGVAFDLQGRRLGRGKGFYDRLLQTLKGVTCGVAYDQQIVGEVPVEAHDVPLDSILTPTRFVQTRGL